MSRSFRRLRGVLLRLARNRRLAVFSGITLLAPALVLFAFDYCWETWFTDGYSLVTGATGLALLKIGLDGKQPDWLDPDMPDSHGP